MEIIQLSENNFVVRFQTFAIGKLPKIDKNLVKFERDGKEK